METACAILAALPTWLNDRPLSGMKPPCTMSSGRAFRWIIYHNHHLKQEQTWHIWLL